MYTHILLITVILLTDIIQAHITGIMAHIRTGDTEGVLIIAATRPTMAGTAIADMGPILTGDTEGGLLIMGTLLVPEGTAMADITGDDWVFAMRDCEGSTFQKQAMQQKTEETISPPNFFGRKPDYQPDLYERESLLIGLPETLAEAVLRSSHLNCPVEISMPYC